MAQSKGQKMHAYSRKCVPFTEITATRFFKPRATKLAAFVTAAD